MGKAAKATEKMRTTDSMKQSRSHDMEPCHATLCVCSVTSGLNLESKFLLDLQDPKKSELYDFRNYNLQSMITKNVHKLYMKCYHSLSLVIITCNYYYIQYKECYHFLFKEMVS